MIGAIQHCKIIIYGQLSTFIVDTSPAKLPRKALGFNSLRSRTKWPPPTLARTSQTCAATMRAR
jgi:hypothetical protein